MATIIIQLTQDQLTNPDLDIRYALPDFLVENVSDELTDDGYDYVDLEIGGPALQIYLQSSNPTSAVPKIISALKSQRLLANDLSTSAIVIQDHDQFRVVHPPDFLGQFPRPRE